MRFASQTPLPAALAGILWERLLATPQWAPVAGHVEEKPKSESRLGGTKHETISKFE
jgi:hypothetical protein